MWLSLWRQRQLSFEGKKCLIKSILSAIPPYYLSMFKAPKGILIKKINASQKNFIWGTKSDERELAWVKWGRCCKPKSQGGLAFKNVERFNSALMGKWFWRALNEKKNTLWVKVLGAKYGKGECWPNQTNKVKGSTWWHDLKGICQLNLRSGWMVRNLRKVGNGQEVKFWKDNWLWVDPLKDKFGRVFNWRNGNGNLVGKGTG